jgi:tRNA threonylcarbamoyladenosine biosynthesis protein TsaE
VETYKFITKSAEETEKFAKNLSEKLEPGDVITLEGDLGAGKTTFTKGLAKGLGIDKVIKSPTFTIIKEYKGSLPLYHMDVYRLEDSCEDLGFEEYFEGNGITVVEWASIISDYLPNSYLEILISHAEENERIIELIPNGDRYRQICKGIKQ